MMTDDTRLVLELTASFKRQLLWYKELHEIGGQLLSKIVLSRGCVAGLNDCFLLKKQVLDKIQSERENTKDLVALWQQRKKLIPHSELTSDLDDVLGRMESAIKEFLESEDQIRRYLEHSMKKGETTTA